MVGGVKEGADLFPCPVSSPFVGSSRMPPPPLKKKKTFTPITCSDLRRSFYRKGLRCSHLCEKSNKAFFLQQEMLSTIESGLVGKSNTDKSHDP